MREIELHAAEGTPILLVANKCDLPSPSSSSSSKSTSTSTSVAIARPRVIDSAGLAAIGKDIGVPVIETSARDRSNVDLAFTMIARSAIDITNQRFGLPSAATTKGNGKEKIIDGTNLDLGDAPTTLRCCVIL
jgi:GTPase SAR1 family protein